VGGQVERRAGAQVVVDVGDHVVGVGAARPHGELPLVVGGGVVARLALGQRELRLDRAHLRDEPAHEQEEQAAVHDPQAEFLPHEGKHEEHRQPELQREHPQHQAGAGEGNDVADPDDVAEEDALRFVQAVVGLVQGSEEHQQQEGEQARERDRGVERDLREGMARGLLPPAGVHLASSTMESFEQNSSSWGLIRMTRSRSPMAFTNTV
jgi:hypothetical protein